MRQRTGFKPRRVLAQGGLGKKKLVAAPCAPENTITVDATSGKNVKFKALVSVIRGRRGVYICNGPGGLLKEPRKTGVSTRRIKPDSIFVSPLDFQRILKLRERTAASKHANKSK